MKIAENIVVKGYQFLKVEMNGEFLSFISVPEEDTYRGIDAAIEQDPIEKAGVICWIDSLFVRFGVQSDGKLQPVTAEAFNALGIVQVIPVLVDGAIRHVKLEAVMQLLAEYAPRLCVTTRYTIGVKKGEKAV